MFGHKRTNRVGIAGEEASTPREQEDRHLRINFMDTDRDFVELLKRESAIK
jgi:hypothetical protein